MCKGKMNQGISFYQFLLSFNPILAIKYLRQMQTPGTERQEFVAMKPELTSFSLN